MACEAGLIEQGSSGNGQEAVFVDDVFHIVKLLEDVFSLFLPRNFVSFFKLLPYVSQEPYSVRVDWQVVVRITVKVVYVASFT